MIVSGIYIEYIPLFLYFMSNSYPEYYSVIVVKDKLTETIKNNLKLLDNSKFIVREDAYKDFSDEPNTVKTLRWVMFLPEYLEYENVFIGDIDIFHMREKSTLLEKHLKICEEYSVPFSNTTGIDDKKTRGYRVTGLHFMNLKELKGKMSLIMFKYYSELKNNRFPKEFYNDAMKRIDNQHALYVMLREAGYEVPDHNHFYYHGFHVGHSRIAGRWTELFKNGNKDEADYEDFYKQFKILADNKIYKKLYSDSSVMVQREINVMTESLENFYDN